MTFERFYKEFLIIFGRLLALLMFKGVITQKDADFINCQISEDEWLGEVQNEQRFNQP